MEGGPNTGVALAKKRFNVDAVTVPFAELGDRLNKAAMDPRLVKRCEGWADAYLKMEGTTMETSRAFLVRSFLLTEVFRDSMDENEDRRVCGQPVPGNDH